MFFDVFICLNTLYINASCLRQQKLWTRHTINFRKSYSLHVSFSTGSKIGEKSICIS